MSHTHPSLKLEDSGGLAGAFTLHTAPLSTPLNYLAATKDQLETYYSPRIYSRFDGTVRNIVKDNEASTPLIILS